jgi:hypothetical protein
MRTSVLEICRSGFSIQFLPPIQFHKGILNTPPWANTTINPCLIKTPKNPVGKYLEKEYMIVVSCVALVASLKTSRDKLQENSWKKKEHNNVFRTNYNLQDYWFYDLLDLKSWIIQECSPPWTMHVSQMSHTNSSNVMTVSDLVNKSDIFLHGFICKMFISPLFWSLWG